MNTKLIEQGQNRRAAILGFVRAYVGRRGYSPTVAEIAAGVGLASGSGMRQHLERLERDGYLTVQPRTSRSIVLTDPAPDGWTRS